MHYKHNKLNKNPYKTEEDFRKMYEIVHSPLSCWNADAWDRLNKQFDEWGVMNSTNNLSNNKQKESLG